MRNPTNSNEVLSQALMKDPAREVSFYHSFSSQERKVLSLMSQGLNMDEIADQMCLSPHTIKTHRKNLVAKSNARNSVHLISMCIKHNII